MGIRELAAGTAITVVIGGSAYTINREEVVDNFADDTGLTQEQSEEYIQGIENDLVSYSELGPSSVSTGQDILNTATQIDCINYEYEWESPGLSCNEGKAQLTELGTDIIALGNAYSKLGSDSASKTDISATVGLIDEVNYDFGFSIVNKMLDASIIDESKKSNSYNKATLQAALNSN